jgi:hypothetical protein
LRGGLANLRLAFARAAPYKHAHSTRGSRDPDSRAAPGGFSLLCPHMAIGEKSITLRGGLNRRS